MLPELGSCEVLIYYAAGILYWCTTIQVLTSDTTAQA